MRFDDGKVSAKFLRWKIFQAFNYLTRERDGSELKRKYCEYVKNKKKKKNTRKKIIE